jgi:hypothetical protein
MMRRPPTGVRRPQELSCRNAGAIAGSVAATGTAVGRRAARSGTAASDPELGRDLAQEIDRLYEKLFERVEGGETPTPLSPIRPLHLDLYHLDGKLHKAMKDAHEPGKTLQ